MGDEELLAYTFEGGVPPYDIFLLKGARYIPVVESLDQQDWQIKMSELQELAGAPGQYSLVITDQDKTYNVLLRKIQVDPVRFPWEYLTPIPVLILLLLINSFRKGRKRKKLRNLKEQRRQEIDQLQQVVEPEPTVTPKETIVMAQLDTSDKEDKAEDTPVQNPDKGEASELYTTGGLRIKGLRKAGTTKPHKVPIREKEPYAMVDLKEIWQDTVVEEIQLGKSCVKKIDHFLKDPKHSIDEQEGKLPEIGGFLMGRTNPLENSNYRVSIEEFVPINPESYSVFQLEFNTSNLVKELGDAQDMFPDLVLVGLVSYTSRPWIISFQNQI